MVLRRLSESDKPRVHAVAQTVISELIQVEDSVLVLPFRQSQSFYRSQVEMPAIRKTIEDAVSEVLGGQWGVRCVTIDEPTVRRADLAELEYVDEMAAEAKALGGEREHDI